MRSPVLTLLIVAAVAASPALPCAPAPAADEPVAPATPAVPSVAARPDYSALLAEMDAHGSALHEPSGVGLRNTNYTVPDPQDGRQEKQAEAILFTPPGNGPWPALLLIPGCGMSARDWTDNGIAFASAGYLCLAVSQPGMGLSEGPADFVGPWTMTVLNAGLDWLKAQPQADPQRLGVVGFSRGAMAASLLATSRDDIQAAVCGGGIYDFHAAFSEISSPMIKTNMVLETHGGEYGLVPSEAAARSSILRMDKLRAKLLIMHGEADVNAPASQAYMLRDRLLELGKVQAQSMADFGPPPDLAAVVERAGALTELDTKPPGGKLPAPADFMLITFPATGHGIGRQNFQGNTLEFLRRVL